MARRTGRGRTTRILIITSPVSGRNGSVVVSTSHEMWISIHTIFAVKKRCSVLPFLTPLEVWNSPLPPQCNVHSAENVKLCAAETGSDPSELSNDSKTKLEGRPPCSPPIFFSGVQSQNKTPRPYSVVPSSMLDNLSMLLTYSFSLQSQSHLNCALSYRQRDRLCYL